MTRLPYSELIGLDDDVVATYLDVLEQQAKAQRKAMRRRGQ